MIANISFLVIHYDQKTITLVTIESAKPCIETAILE